MAPSSSPRRVAVTGLSLLTPLGNDLATSWQGLINGQSGITSITRFDPTGHRSTVAGELKNFDPSLYMDKKTVKRIDPFIQYAVAGGQMAWNDCGFEMTEDFASRAGCILGCGMGGLLSIVTSHKTFLDKGPDRVSPFFIPTLIPNMGAGQVAIELNLKGPNLVVCTACAAGTHAIGLAFQYIRDHGYDMMVTGGTEATITPVAVAGFDAMKALSTARNDDPTKASRPFDRDRDGFVMGEGAGIMILEEWNHAVARGAKIYAEVVGAGSSADAHHITSPPDDGSGAVAAMRAAFKDAASSGITPEDIGYINAHGTSTELNDLIETRAIKACFGEDLARKIPISSTKSMTGHLLGAAGGLEGVISVMALHEGVLPPTINLDNPDPGCDLDYIPKEARQAKPKAALSNSFGFGGANGTLIFKAV